MKDGADKFKYSNMGKVFDGIHKGIQAFTTSDNGRDFLESKKKTVQARGLYGATEQKDEHLLGGYGSYSSEYSTISSEAAGKELAKVAMTENGFDIMNQIDFIELCNRKEEFHTQARAAYSETVFTDYDEKNTEVRHHSAVEESWKPIYFIIGKFEQDVKQEVADNLSVEKFEGLKGVIERHPGVLKYVLLEASKTPELLNALLQEYGKDIPQKIQEDLTKSIIEARNEKVFEVLLDNKVQSAMKYAFRGALTRDINAKKYVEIKKHIARYGNDLSEENKTDLMNEVLGGKPVNEEIFKLLAEARFPIEGRHLGAVVAIMQDVNQNFLLPDKLNDMLNSLNLTTSFKNGLFTKLAAQEQPNTNSIRILIDNGASPEKAAQAFVNKPEALKYVLENYGDKLTIQDKNSILDAAIRSKNPDSVKHIIESGAQITYETLKMATDLNGASIKVVSILLQNGAPTQSRSVNILDNLENNPQKEAITGLVAGHEALRNGFESVKQELLKRDDFKDMKPEELMDIIRTVMLQEGGAVREYFDNISKDKKSDMAKEFINEISLTYWEEFKTWVVSIFSDKTQEQLRAELITPQLDELFKKEMFDAVNREIQTDIPAQNRETVASLEGKRGAVQSTDEEKKTTFVEKILAERAARGQSQGQDDGIGGR